MEFYLRGRRIIWVDGASDLSMFSRYVGAISNGEADLELVVRKCDD